jgi:hypothetical protein
MVLSFPVLLSIDTIRDIAGAYSLPVFHSR